MPADTFEYTRLEQAARAVAPEEAPLGPGWTVPETLARIRFQPERELLDSLFERFGLEEILSHFESSGGARSLHDLVLGTHIRLTEVLAPRLFHLFADVREAAGFDEPVQLFVLGDPDMNAFAMNSWDPELPHAVSLTSGAVERMTDAELRFVLGHEIGHLAYRHYRVNLIPRALEDDEGESLVPPLLHRRLQTLGRLAELSADRAGFLAAGRDLQTAVSVFFKLTAGLGPEHLQFDIDAFLAQLADLRTMKRSQVLAAFSHPVTPVRVRALQRFADLSDDASPEERAALDAEVSEVAQLMELEVTRPEAVHARDLLVAGGLLAVHADGRPPTKDQHGFLVEALLPLTADPEALMRDIEGTEQAQDTLIEAASWLREHAGEERYVLFNRLAQITCCDGELHPKERAYLHRVADLLGIPRKAAADRMFEVLRFFLQERSGGLQSSGVGSWGF